MSPTPPTAPPNRRQAAEDAAAAARRRRVLIAVALGVLAVIAIGVIVFGLVAARRSTEKTSPAGSASPAASGTVAPPPEGTKTFEVKDPQHVSGPVDYPQKPPVGGDHAPVWQNCGTYAQPVTTEAAVHSLEHGAVWITYRPGLPAADIERLQALARNQPYLLVSPWADDSLPAPVVASSWGRQLTLDSAGDPRLAAFVRAFAQSEDAPEPGAPCNGGTGRPV